MGEGRILLADANRILLHRLEGLLALEFEVVGAVSDGPALVEAAQQLNPQVILMDVSLPPLGGFEAARQLKACAPTSKLVFLSSHDDPGYAAKGKEVGALGLLLKQRPEEIMPFIRRTLQGHDPA